MTGRSLLRAIPRCRRVFASIATDRVHFRRADYTVPSPPFFSLGAVSLVQKQPVVHPRAATSHTSSGCWRESDAWNGRGVYAVDAIGSAALDHRAPPCPWLRGAQLVCERTLIIVCALRGHRDSAGWVNEPVTVSATIGQSTVNG
jgi:hypothetical protein